MLPGDKKEKCFVCGLYGYTDRHHIFGGSVRQVSERYDLTVHLCKNCHQGTFGVHGKNGANLQRYLHETGQEYFESCLIKQGLTPEQARQRFIDEFIRSYL